MIGGLPLFPVRSHLASGGRGYSSRPRWQRLCGDRMRVLSGASYAAYQVGQRERDLDALVRSVLREVKAATPFWQDPAYADLARAVNARRAAQ